MKLVERPGGPGDRDAVGLVAHEAHHGLAELVADGALVALVNDGEEGARGVGVEKIERRVLRVLSKAGVVDIARGRRAILPIRGRNVPGPGRRCPIELAIDDIQRDGALGGALYRPRGQGLRRQVERDRLAARGAPVAGRHQRLHALVRVVAGERASGKPAGVAAFVHQPYAHAALAGPGHGELHTRKPGVGKVIDFQSVVSPDHDAGDPVGVHVVQVADDVRLRHLPVPEPPQHHSVFSGRRREIGSGVARGGHGDLLPWPVGGDGREGQEKGRDQRSHDVAKRNTPRPPKARETRYTGTLMEPVSSAFPSSPRQ